MSENRPHEVALCAVQLALGMADFASERHYRAAIERALATASVATAGARHRLFVFPENTGHFIPFIHAPRAARSQPSLTRAMALLAARHPLRLAGAMVGARTRDLQKALMLDILPAADALMRSIFSMAARQARAYIVAGSHLLARAGTVTNTSYTFGPDGALLGTTSKVNLVPHLEDHRPGGTDLARGHAGELAVIDTPFGGLATLICYDGFHVPHTRDEPEFAPVGPHIDALGARVIANPSANPWPWRGRWLYAVPDGPQTRDRQWRCEGLPGTMARLRRVRYGVTAHLCAEILDFRFEGPSEILARRDERADDMPYQPAGLAADRMDRVEVLARAADERSGQVVVAHVPASSGSEE